MATIKDDAFATIRGLLRRYGLGSLDNWAWQLIVANRSAAEIEIMLDQRPEFRERFAAKFEREQLGLAPISADEIIAYENTVRQMATNFGLPANFMSQERIKRLIVGDLAPTEVQSRMELFAQAAFQVPAETRLQLRELYGVSEGDLAAFFINEEEGLQHIQKKFSASQIAGAAQFQQFGQLSRTEAERIASVATPQQAAERFGALATAQELLSPLPGTAETGISRDVQLGFVAGEQAAAQQLQQQARRRQSVFEAGGQFATTELGVTGLGSAAR